MFIVRRSSTHWPLTNCAACTKHIHPNEPAFILTLNPATRFTLCQDDGEAIACNPRPNELLAYWNLFPIAPTRPQPPTRT